MNLEISPRLPDLAKSRLEVVERKGRGHPDTLSDRLAEELSKTYSQLSREKFGTILRHQFDKLTLMGGKCDVYFGGGGFRSPVRLLIPGRATPQVGKEKLQYRDALVDTAANFLEQELRNFDFLTNCRLIIETSINTTRGVIEDTDRGPSRSSAYSRFRPGKLTDLPEYTRPVSNDTAVGIGFAPYTPLENMVLEIEGTLNADAVKKRHTWLGSDIKTLAFRVGNKVNLTICVPQISTAVSSLDEYKTNREMIASIIKGITDKYQESFKTEVHLTTGDKSRQDLMYMLYTGSCIESGDEGQVGRGNRLGGVISSRRPFSIEGLNGKNPQYHGGKLYSVIAWELASKIWKEFDTHCEVYVASQTDRPLDDPWMVVIRSGKQVDRAAINKLVGAMFNNIGSFTTKILEGKYPLV